MTLRTCVTALATLGAASFAGTAYAGSHAAGACLITKTDTNPFFVKMREGATAKAEEMVGKAREQSQEILSNAQRQANETLDRARDEARAEGDRIVAAAREEVDQAVASAKEDLRREVGELAVVGAERILKREIDAKAHNDIIDDLVTEIR